MYRLSQVRIPSENTKIDPEKKSRLKQHIFFTVVSAIVVVACSNFLVNSSVAIAYRFGVSQEILGATIVAAGTSYPN